MLDGNKLLDYLSLRWCTSSILLVRLLVWAKVADSEGPGDPAFSNLLKRCPCNTLVGHLWGTANSLFHSSLLGLMKFKTMPEVPLPFLGSTSHTGAHIHTHPDTIFESYPLNNLSTRVCKFFSDSLSWCWEEMDATWSSYNTTERERDHESLIAEFAKKKKKIRQKSLPSSFLSPLFREGRSGIELGKK